MDALDKAKKEIAKIYRKAADELDPPCHKTRKVESRLDKMKVLANAKPFTEAEATQIISAIVKKTSECVVVFYTERRFRMVGKTIQQLCVRTSNN